MRANTWPMSIRMSLLATAACLLLGSAAMAEDFHGFDPTNFDGKMVSADQLKAMVTDAVAVHAPNNGKQLVIGFANLARDQSFLVNVEKGIVANADAAGVELQVVDNHLDGPTALANVESFINRHVDYIIEFQIDANFGPTIAKKIKDAGIKTVAIDIPMPDTTFFGANNPRSGFMAGAYLGQAALQKFGADRVKAGYFVVGDLPEAGAVPAMRSNGQVAGFLGSVADFPADHMLHLDSKNTLDVSYAQMKNVLGRIPAGVPIMITAINDQATIGMLRAVKQAGREADLIAVGLGAAPNDLKIMLTEPTMVGSVAYFPERYGNYLIPLALMDLAGKPIPASVLVHHEVVTRGNICNYYAEFKCSATPDPVTFKFPDAAFKAHLEKIRKLPELQGSLNLIPND